MKVVLLTTSNCQPCERAKQVLEPYIKAGEIEVMDIQQNDQAADLALKGNLTTVPQLLVVSKTGEIFAQLGIEDKGT